jgi:probable rRNA maturation factor
VAVDVRGEVTHGRQFVPTLRKEARATLELLELGLAELSVLLTDDDTIRALNRDYRGKDRPTDVLSFPQLDELTAGGASRGGAADTKRPPLPLGDIVISLETATRQAEALAIATPSRLRTLLIHGLLHLLGYDHERSPAEARRMFARERELAARLDTSATVTAPPASRRRVASRTRTSGAPPMHLAGGREREARERASRSRPAPPSS